MLPAFETDKHITMLERQRGKVKSTKGSVRKKTNLLTYVITSNNYYMNK